MNRRRATSTTSLSGTIQRNMRYVTHLRRRIRDLEEEAAELSQRLNMLLADVDVNMAQNNDLWHFQQEVEQQVQFQNALNYSLEEEIRQLRELIGQEAQEQAEAQPQGAVNIGGAQPSTSQGSSGPAAEPEDVNPAPAEPKEPEEK